ncbi:conserved hypothetical protein, putative Cupredoxin [Nitrospina gracilis 3/211]|uniref:EfeO-type cupredoxin-like domain-containing protein n=1 Tax=Nitrospina gracilis (strain 3/211) TaxID=1266370 RepID=M1YYY3_NITG3|nr:MULTISPECIES: hypothetical protein [Nitrospina]MCF8723822.1 hypothetical protein [Nitrospina sp. Nb-3]CCQ90938.1 conserved hypothetical protein, putative Cupredoxin [Nitrospina gracilis 3/211]
MNPFPRKVLLAALVTAAAFLTTTIPADAETYLLRTISLTTVEGEASEYTYHVPAGKSVRVQNDLDRVIHNTSIARVNPDKNMVRVQAFQPGQSMDLEFTAQGTYRICYEWKPKHATVFQQSCVRVNVVKLQST